MAPPVGFEPTTNGLTVRCATAAPQGSSFEVANVTEQTQAGQAASLLVLGANKLSGLVARDLSGFMATQEVSHETDRSATGDPENAI